MKKMLNLIIGAFIISTLLCLNGILCYAADMKGSGTEASPYIVETEDHLISIMKGEYPKSAYYVLGNDIKLITRSWTPICSSEEDGFTGRFNGNNHTISGLAIGNTTNSYENIGLFSQNAGIISNLSVESSSIIGNKYTGIIAGTNKGEIINCTVKGIVSSENYYTDDTSLGGIVGNNYGIITECESDAEIKDGNTNTGGIAGYSEGTVSDCSFTGTATDIDTKYFGGIVGYSCGTIQNCSNTGIINAYLNYLGGIVGYADSGIIRCSSNTSSLVSKTTYDSYTGGLVGYNNDARISNCYSIGNITCSNTSNYNTYVAGFIGYNESSEYVENCYCIGKVLGKTASAFSNGPSTLYTNCFYNKTVQPTTETGAFGLTDTEMKDIANCRANFTFWDFSSIWGINENINNGYPHILSMVVPVTGITVDDDSLTIALGESVQLSASILPEDASNKAYKWSSSDPNIVSLDSSNGIITANKLGTAVITAESIEGGFTSSCKITVVANTSLNETLIFKIDDASTIRGQKITVPVRLLTGNSTGVSEFALDVHYDDIYLTPVENSLKSGNLFSYMDFDVDTANKIIHITASSPNNTIGNGIVCYLDFKTSANYKENIESHLFGSVKKLKALVGTTEKNLKSAIYEGIVTISNVLYGDVNGDNRLTAADAALVLQKVLDSNFNLPIEIE